MTGTKSLMELAAAEASAPARYATRAAGAILQALEQGRARGMDGPRLEQMKTELLEAAAAEVTELTAKELEGVRSELGKARESWERSQERNRERLEVEARRYERRVNAMTPDEVEQEMTQVLGGEARTPDEVDILSAAVKRDLPTLAETFRSHVKETGLYEPWKLTDSGKTLSRAERTLAEVGKTAGAFTVQGAAVTVGDLVMEGSYEQF